MTDLIINPKHTEQSEILADLQSYVQAQPDETKWNDFYSGGGGQILLGLIASLGAFDAFHDQNVLREQSRSLAVLSSSIREHAFNSGIFEAPTPTLELEYEVQVNTGVHVLISEGDLIARLGTYEVYSLENIDQTGDFTIRVAVGILESVTHPVNGAPFKQWTYDLAKEFVATSLESLTVDGSPLNLRDDPSDLSQLGVDFVLRQAIPNEVRIYTGNGVLGWNDPDAQTATYQYLNYGRDLASMENLLPVSLLPNTMRIIRQTVVQRPVYGIDKEELRGLTLYYPIDGRIVHDRHYEGVIMKNFGGVLDDVYSWNTDPDQRVRLLVSEGYDETIHKPQIVQLVDSKRGPSIQVLYETVHATDGVSIALSFCVPKLSYPTYLAKREDILEFLEQRNLKFVRKDTVIRNEEIAVDLTKRYGIEFYPTSSTEYTLEAGEFISNFDVQVTKGS